MRVKTTVNSRSVHPVTCRHMPSRNIHARNMHNNMHTCVHIHMHMHIHVHVYVLTRRRGADTAHTQTGRSAYIRGTYSRVHTMHVITRAQAEQRRSSAAAP
jgi:hypothetical protein